MSSKCIYPYGTGPVKYTQCGHVLLNRIGALDMEFETILGSPCHTLMRGVWGLERWLHAIHTDTMASL